MGVDAWYTRSVPELPDVELYLHALTPRVIGQRVEAVRIGNPFIVRTFDPPIASIVGQTVRTLRRLGKRIVFGLDDEPLRDRPPDDRRSIPVAGAGRGDTREGRAASPWTSRAARCCSPSRDRSVRRPCTWFAASPRSPNTIPAASKCSTTDLAGFAQRLTAENHTLKRALTDPRIFSGIGNAYSDEILHAARLSPMKQTASLTDDEVERLFHFVRETLTGLGRAAQGARPVTDSPKR